MDIEEMRGVANVEVMTKRARRTLDQAIDELENEHERRDEYARAAVVKALRSVDHWRSDALADQVENGAPL